MFLHEGLGSVSLWRDFPHRLAAATGRPALVYSRHGYGWSDPLTSPQPVDFMHREALTVLPAVVDTLEIGDPWLIGHSDGASIALIQAGIGGLDVRGMVALAPHVFVEPESLAGARTALQAFETTDMAERMSRYHRDPAATFYGWYDAWQSPDFREWNIEGVLGGIDCPVLVVQGADDQYGTVAQLDAIETGVAGFTRRLWLEECGHSPHLDRPTEVLTATVAFVETFTDPSD